MIDGSLPAKAPSSPPPDVRRFLNQYATFFIAGHKEPDADCVGSQLALSSLLRRLGKKAVLCSAGPFKRHEIIPFEYLFLTEDAKIRAEIKAQKGTPAAIIVDCSSPDRLGGIEKSLEGLPLAVIDHHAVGGGESGIGVRYIDAAAPACVALIFSLFQAFDFALTREEAEALFLGLCADTGFFRHLDSGGAETFTLACELTRRGANPKQAFAAIHGGKTFSSRRLLGAILSRAETYFDGRLIVSSEALAETERYGHESRDSDTLYQLLLSVEGVEAVAVVRQESEGNCVAGLRSVDAIDVAAVAADFGGGGHKNAAGFSHKGSAGEVEQALIVRFAKSFT
jgi:phosphoesterase RecJ-like protein